MQHDVYTIPAVTFHNSSVLPQSYLPRPWHITNRDLTSFWEHTNGGERVHIAVLDTGVDRDHAGLLNAEIEVCSVLSEDDGGDRHGHGTQMIGLIADRSCGIAPNARITSIKVLNDQGFGIGNSIIKGIEKAIDIGVDIISMSFGSSAMNLPISQVCRKAYEAGVLLLAASGNEAATAIRYPAALENYVLSVGAVNEQKRRSVFSNFDGSAERLDVVDFGEQVITTHPGNRYVMISGTSPATALCAGSFANVLSLRKKHGSWTSTMIAYAQLLEEVCEDLGRDGRDRELGWGIIDPVKGFTI